MKHIAIMREPFLSMILSKEKTIESRWSMNKIAPFNKAKIGDEILFKETGKNITAKAKIKDVKFIQLTPKIADEIKEKYGDEIVISKFKNWQERKHKNYLTLIWLKDVKQIDEIKAPKSHGAGWIIIH